MPDSGGVGLPRNLGLVAQSSPELIFFISRIAIVRVAAPGPLQAREQQRDPDPFRQRTTPSADRQGGLPRPFRPTYSSRIAQLLRPSAAADSGRGPRDAACFSAPAAAPSLHGGKLRRLTRAASRIRISPRGSGGSEIGWAPRAGPRASAARGLVGLDLSFPPPLSSGRTSGCSSMMSRSSCQFSPVRTISTTTRAVPVRRRARGGASTGLESATFRVLDPGLRGAPLRLHCIRRISIWPTVFFQPTRWTP